MKDEIKEMFNKIMILEQELETYKKGYKSMEANNQQLKLHLQICKTDLDKLQDRIDKAIELLNDWNYLDKIDCYYEPKEVIDILQGKSDE